MSLVEELNIEKVKRKGLLWIATPLTRLVMTAHLKVITKSMRGMKELKVNRKKLKVIYMVQKIAPYNFLIKICSILKIYNF